MDFKLPEELKMIQSLTRDFVNDRLKPLERDILGRAADLSDAGLYLPVETEAALVNAFILDMAIGASTNTLLHLPAIAREAGYHFNLKRINAIAARVPNLVRIEPSKLDDGTKYWMIDLYEAGGIPAVMKELGDLLDLDVMTVDGRLGDRLDGVVNKNPKVIRTRENAYSDTGGIGVFYGSLAPEGSVIKLTGVDKKFPSRFEGQAVVFHSEKEATDFLDKKGNAQPGMVVVINYEGLAGGPGMQEMLYPTASLTKTGMDNQIALITDGRFSGGTRGPCFGHVGPEAYCGGPIAYVKNGDRIVIDMAEKTIDLCISVAEMEDRKKSMPRVEHPAPRGVLARCRREALDRYI